MKKYLCRTKYNQAFEAEFMETADIDRTYIRDFEGKTAPSFATYAGCRAYERRVTEPGFLFMAEKEKGLQFMTEAEFKRDYVIIRELV